VGPAPYQYSPVNANLGSPGFLNASAGNSGGGNNCGAYGLRFLYFNVYPFDGTSASVGNRKIVQFSGGVISGDGVKEVSALLPNPTEYGSWNGNSGEYLYSDDGGTIQLDSGIYQGYGNAEFLTYRPLFPVRGAHNLSVALGVATQNYNTLSGGATVNYVGGCNLGGKIYARVAQNFASTGYTNGFLVDTTTPTCAAAKLTTQSLGGPVYQGAQGISLLNPQGVSLFWDSTNQYLGGCLSNLVPYSAISGPLATTTGEVQIEFADSTDNELIGSGGLSSPVSMCIICGGNFMLHSLQGGTTYYIILKDLTGYYKVVFTPADTATNNALQQSGYVPSTAGSYGQDVYGEFWFQAPPSQGAFPLLYSTLTYTYEKLFTGLMPYGLPYINFQATNCRRLVSQFRNLFEG
jgi:hypothetical protein